MSAPVVSVCVPIFNNGDVVDELFDSLARQEFDEPWEVVVADNGSSDDSRERVLAWTDRLPSLRLVDATDVAGQSHARNRAAEEAGAEYLLFVDADDVVTDGWLAALAGGLRRCGLASGPYDEETLNDKCARAWAMPHRPKDHLPTVFDFLPAALGNNFAIRASVLRDVGGWNEDYHYGEDVELSWRSQLAGHELCFVPEAVVQYRHRADIRSLARQQYFRAYGRGPAAGHYLSRDFGPHGYDPPSEAGRFLERLLFMIRNLPLIPFSRLRRGLWVKHAAYGWGWLRARLEGKHRLQRSMTTDPGATGGS